LQVFEISLLTPGTVIEERWHRPFLPMGSVLLLG
jgi:hypothetical protein